MPNERHPIGNSYCLYAGFDWIFYATRTYDPPVLAAGGHAGTETILEYLMHGFDTPDLQLSGLGDRQAGNTTESWKRFLTATLMATAALLLCAALVVILAPLLPHPVYVTHAAGLDVSPLTRLARG